MSSDHESARVEAVGSANVSRKLRDTWDAFPSESTEPDRVNAATLEKCRRLCAERPLKAVVRRVMCRFLDVRFRFRRLGEGFRWGSGWRVRRHALSVGDFVFIGPDAHIIYPTVIGDLVLMAPGVHIVGNDHGIRTPGDPIRVAAPVVPSKQKLTTIESEVWIGQRATIIHGVTIGRGSIVSSGSVVTKDVPPYSIVAGVPARIVRMRFSEDEIKEHEKALYDQ